MKPAFLLILATFCITGCLTKSDKYSDLASQQESIFTCREDNAGTWLGCGLTNGPRHVLVDTPTTNLDQWAYYVTASYQCHLDESFKGRESTIAIKIGDNESKTFLKLGEETSVMLEGFSQLYLEDQNPSKTRGASYFLSDAPCDISVRVVTSPGTATIQKWELRASQLHEELPRARKLMFLKQRLDYYYDPGTSELEKSGILILLEGYVVDDPPLKSVIDNVVSGYPAQYINEVLGDAPKQYSRLIGEAEVLLETMTKWNLAQRETLRESLNNAKRPL